MTVWRAVIRTPTLKLPRRVPSASRVSRNMNLNHKTGEHFSSSVDILLQRSLAVGVCFPSGWDLGTVGLLPLAGTMVVCLRWGPTKFSHSPIVAAGDSLEVGLT